MQNPEKTAVDTFYVLDLDRCLVNTEKLQLLLQQIIQRELGILPDEMNLARREYERAGGSFDTAGYVMGVLDGKNLDGPAVWHEITRIFIRESQAQDMLQPYASELLRRLDTLGARFGIVTYGNDAWQLTKLEAASLSAIPHLVTHDVAKARLIASWQHQEGFLVPTLLAGAGGSPLIARQLVLIDDKPVSFIGLPAGARGVCAIAPGATWPDELLVRLPSNVSVTYGLHGAIELLFSH